jgi:hypothetical protein
VVLGKRLTSFSLWFPASNPRQSAHMREAGIGISPVFILPLVQSQVTARVNQTALACRLYLEENRGEMNLIWSERSYSHPAKKPGMFPMKFTPFVVCATCVPEFQLIECFSELFVRKVFKSVDWSDFVAHFASTSGRLVVIGLMLMSCDQPRW